MRKKDQSLLKKAIGNADSCPVTRTASCYVLAEDGTVKMQKSTWFESEEEEKASQLIAFMKKAVTGKEGVTSIELIPEENLLEKIIKTEMKDEEPVMELFNTIAENYPSDEDYGIFVAFGNIGTGSIVKSEEDFYSFVIVMIQPCTLSKAGLVYDYGENIYVDRIRDRPLGAPVHSFIWPSLDEGEPDAGRVSYFSKNEKIQSEIHAVIENIFGTDIPLSAVEQKEGFVSLMNAANDGGSIPYDEVQRVYEKFAEKQAAAYAEGKEGALTINELTDIIKTANNINEDAVAAVNEIAEDYKGKEFSLGNIAPKNISINTDKAKLKVELSDISDLEVVDWKGRRCIVVPLSDAEFEELKVR